MNPSSRIRKPASKFAKRHEGNQTMNHAIVFGTVGTIYVFLGPGEFWSSHMKDAKIYDKDEARRIARRVKKASKVHNIGTYAI